MTPASVQVMPVVVSSTLRSPLGKARPGRAPLPARYRPVAAEETETRDLHTVVCGYRIGRLRARGGTSVLFDVTHPYLREPLVMKVVIDRRMQGASAAAAIHAHAQKVALLVSPHVVRTFDAGRLPTGEPFVVMERLDGDDLEVVLRDRGPLPVDDAVHLVMQACSGLEHAHATGLVHGDLKPGNLVLASDERGARGLRIIDFAPAVPNDEDPGDPLVTCSPGYAAPEQLGARRDVDARADVFALGAVLYELVTGSRAYEASTLHEMVQVMDRAPPSMRVRQANVPPELDDVVRRCLARDRGARFASVAQLRGALGEALATAARAREGDRLGAAPAAVGATRNAKTTVASRARAPRLRWSRMARRVFLAALGPASALVSMTLVRLVMASTLVAPPLATSPAPPAAPAHVPAQGPALETVPADLATR